MTVSTPKKTQKQTLLELLERGPVCSFEFYYHPDLTHKITTRKSELVAEGHPIVTVGRCTRHDHDSNAVEWRLEDA